MPRRYQQPNLTRDMMPEAGDALKRAAKSRPLSPRVRILPLTMIMAFLLLSVKVGDLYQSGKAIQVRLQEAKASNAPYTVASPATAQEEGQQGEAGADTDGQAAEAEQSEEQEKIAKLKDENEKMTGQQRQFSPIEVDLLQSLRERREEIEARARELDLKEKLLDATELRINDKITEIKALEQNVSTLLEQYSKAEESHVRSLVKIYESMKPKSAAVIFNELELPILLEVIDQMSERKVAPILAAMDPMKAKEVTSDLAELRKLNTNKLRR